VRHTRIL